MQTLSHRAKDPVRKDAWTRMTKFFGSMLIVNFGIGIATGIVQEFQFGLNWSEYARYVGDVFGAPLALEGLAAFFQIGRASCRGRGGGRGRRGRVQKKCRKVY